MLFRVDIVLFIKVGSDVGEDSFGTSKQYKQSLVYQKKF